MYLLTRVWPWEKTTHARGLKGRERFLAGIGSASVQVRFLAVFQTAFLGVLATQGIGLRPQPWAKFSRPVGPAPFSPSARSTATSR